MAEPLIAGVELGGTKVNCILASGPDRIEDEVRLSTERPETTLAAVERVLDGWTGLAAIGVASFGPVGIDPAAADWGRVTVTTKTGIYGTNYIQRALVTAIGLGANRPQDAVYPTSMKSASGEGCTRSILAPPVASSVAA